MIECFLEKGENMVFTVVDRGDLNSKKVKEIIKMECLKHNWILDDKNPQLVFSVGGDGTLLHAIHHYIDQLDTVAFVGIHTGTLGFFTDYTQDQLDDFFKDLFSKEAVIESFPMLKIEVADKKYYGFNEARIGSWEQTLSLDVYIDEEYFERTNGSGICISTQYGSTAINRALNGAVVDPGIQVLQLTEIMPLAHTHHHSLGNPYIMKEDRVVKVKGNSLKNATLSFDHHNIPLTGVQKIQISTSNKKVRFARYRTYSYLKRLKNLY